MQKITKSILVIVFVAVLAVGATSAAWSDTEVNPNNYFETGTLNLTINPTTAMFNATGIYPGWSQTQQLAVTNAGTVPLNYDIVASNSAGDATLYNSAAFKLDIGTTSGGTDVYSGTVAGLTTLGSVRALASGASETLYFTVKLDATAPNGLQGTNTTVDFTFNATQP